MRAGSREYDCWLKLMPSAYIVWLTVVLGRVFTNLYNFNPEIVPLTAVHFGMDRPGCVWDLSQVLFDGKHLIHVTV